MSSPSSALGQNKRASWPLRQRFSAFLRWWKGELTALLPAAWRDLASLGGSGTLLSVQEDELIAYDLRLGKLVEVDRVRLATLDPAGQQLAFRNVLAKQKSGSADNVRLCLDSTQCLRTRVKLPLATEENLQAVLGFEMDRHTPFKAEQVYFDYRVIRRDANQGLIDLELTLAPKPVVDGLAARISAMGGHASSAVFIEDMLKPSPYPDLLKQTPRFRVVDSKTRKLNLALGGVLLLLLGIVVVVPIWQKRTAAIALLPQLAQAKSQADATETVRKGLEKLAAENNYILARKHTQPSPLSVVEDLSRVLPDTTWAQTLEIKSGAKSREVVVTGETASSSKLIEIIEQTGTLQNASFRSPLTKGQSPNSERFVLGAEVKTRSLPAPVADSELTGLAPAVPAPLPSVPLPQAPVPAVKPDAVTLPVAPAATSKPGDGKAPANPPADAGQPLPPPAGPGAPAKKN